MWCLCVAVITVVIFSLSLVYYYFEGSYYESGGAAESARALEREEAVPSHPGRAYQDEGVAPSWCFLMPWKIARRMIWI